MNIRFKVSVLSPLSFTLFVLIVYFVGSTALNLFSQTKADIASKSVTHSNPVLNVTIPLV